MNATRLPFSSCYEVMKHSDWSTTRFRTHSAHHPAPNIRLSQNLRASLLCTVVSAKWRGNSDSQAQIKRSEKPRQRSSILARDALQKIENKRRQEADGKLKRAKKAVIVAENKAKNSLRDRGMRARKDGKVRQTFHKANSGLVGNKVLLLLKFYRIDQHWIKIINSNSGRIEK